MVGDKTLYCKPDENGDLEGIVLMYVDDFSLAGTKDFLNALTEEIKKTLDVLKVGDKKFRFTRIDVNKIDDRIEILMNDYAAYLEDIVVRDDALDKKLTQDEMHVFRKYIRKLSWLAANTRPDLLIHALDLAQSKSRQYSSVNRVLMKVSKRESKVMFRRLERRESFVFLV